MISVCSVRVCARIIRLCSETKASSFDRKDIVANDATLNIGLFISLNSHTPGVRARTWLHSLMLRPPDSFAPRQHMQVRICRQRFVNDEGSLEDVMLVERWKQSWVAGASSSHRLASTGRSAADASFGFEYPRHSVANPAGEFIRKCAGGLGNIFNGKESRPGLASEPSSVTTSPTSTPSTLVTLSK